MYSYIRRKFYTPVVAILVPRASKKAKLIALNLYKYDKRGGGGLVGFIAFLSPPQNRVL
jgi:hypothetical protein